MTTFEDVLYKAKTVAEAAGKKTSDFVEVTKLKMEAAELEKDIASTLEGLGRLVYDGQKAGEDVTALVEGCIAKTDELMARLTKTRTQIDDYKNIIRCKKCSAVNPEDAAYCQRCGSKLGAE